jgi:hypothetical protein
VPLSNDEDICHDRRFDRLLVVVGVGICIGIDVTVAITVSICIAVGIAIAVAIGVSVAIASARSTMEPVVVVPLVTLTGGVTIIAHHTLAMIATVEDVAWYELGSVMTAHDHHDGHERRGEYPVNHMLPLHVLTSRGHPASREQEPSGRWNERDTPPLGVCS